MGIAKVCIGKTYTVCGTTDYFAPEVLRQTGHNRAVDWWALGVMIYIMMTGRSPFDAPDTMKIYRKIMKGFAKVTFPSDFPEQTISMIRALCQRNPEERLTMGNLGVQNFKDHPWYRGFVWKELQSLRMVAPYVPSKAEDDIVASVARKHSKSELEEEGDALGDDDDDESTPPASSWDDVFDPCYVFAATDTRVTSITSLEN
jgi:serine/threonine protein kinase